mmetsp:Transcript_52392/g.104112  ORF Transcript_52392/g.104112 Transcript_52392/m.104112 type:complete len:227 (-) Transcript_52392:808-1488(-)
MPISLPWSPPTRTERQLSDPQASHARQRLPACNRMQSHMARVTPPPASLRWRAFERCARPDHPHPYNASGSERAQAAESECNHRCHSLPDGGYSHWWRRAHGLTAPACSIASMSDLIAATSALRASTSTRNSSFSCCNAAMVEASVASAHSMTTAGEAAVLPPFFFFLFSATAGVAGVLAVTPSAGVPPVPSNWSGPTGVKSMMASADAQRAHAPLYVADSPAEGE